MKTNTYNPDVLNCLANLSNDEVFTPPSLANQVLDLLPKEVFTSPETTFLDPVSKSGVFLREIVKRLDRGLEPLMPNRRERIEHILKKQVFGIAITELTSHLSRRSVYCSKDASSEYSVIRFATESGNILYSPLHHTWQNGKCRYCGASQEVYDRGDQAEQYAYQFIHTDNPHTLFNNMKFDVIIGNPPYQLSDGGDAASDAAMPIYNKFILQALKLTPAYLIMIIPSKWMVGGRGLLPFRQQMMKDRHIRRMVDYENPFDCFPGVHIDGGVCYFLWDRGFSGLTEYTFIPSNEKPITTHRTLYSEGSEIIIRDYRRLSIIDKVKTNTSFSDIVSARKPFGIGTDLFNCTNNYKEYDLHEKTFEGSVKIFGVKGKKGGAKRVVGWIRRKSVEKGVELINKFKLYISKAYSSDAVNPPELIIGAPNDLCTETFLVIGPFKTASERDNCLSYTKTNFFKILLFWGRGTMQVSREVFRFVPLQDFSHPWTDEMLYQKYGLTDEEVAFIESMIRPME